MRKIRETAASLRGMTEDQLHTTTRRTIKVNEQTTSELMFLSKKTEKRLAENNRLQGLYQGEWVIEKANEYILNMLTDIDLMLS